VHSACHERYAATRVAPPPGHRLATAWPEPGSLSSQGIAGGVVGTLAVSVLTSTVFSGGTSGADDLFLDSAGLSAGDVCGAGLWSTALFYATPWQLLLLFLGRVDTERPSDGTLRLLQRLAGADEASEPAPALLLVNAAFYCAAGCAVSYSCSAALGGESTWGVATGLGAVLGAAVFELGRPRKLSAAQQSAVDVEWRNFCSFAGERLARKGRCHEREVVQAQLRWRRASGVRRPELVSETAAERELRAFVAAWAPGSERTSGGFYKGLSVVPDVELAERLRAADASTSLNGSDIA